jgi:hypothetical protein
MLPIVIFARGGVLGLMKRPLVMIPSALETLDVEPTVEIEPQSAVVRFARRVPHCRPI